MKRPVLFIGYEVSIHDEIRDFLGGRGIEPHFAGTTEEVLKMMHTMQFNTIVLRMQRLEDAAILRYINIHYHRAQVLVVPGEKMKEVIPALAAGHYELLQEPQLLEELERHIGVYR